VVLVVLAGCFETPPPTWLLEDPEILALRVEVIEDGPLSTDLAPIPADRVRTEALPGDVLRLRALVAGAGGEVPAEEVDIAWFACMGGACLTELWDARRRQPCGVPLDIGQGCAIGRGPDAELVMPPVVASGFGLSSSSTLTIGAVMGSRGLSTDECLERLQQQPFPPLSGCSLFEQWVASGPLWKIVELLGDGVPDPGEPAPELRLLPPNFNPELERFTVFVADARDRTIAARDGDHVAVHAGDRVRVRLDYDPRDTQEYLLGFEGEIAVTGDVLQAEFFADAAFSTDTESFQASDELTWTVPDDAPVVTIAFVVRDSQRGVGWGTLAFDVEGAAP